MSTVLQAPLVLAGVLGRDLAPVARGVSLQQPRRALAGGVEERHCPRRRHDPAQIEEGRALRRGPQARPPLIVTKASANASVLIRSQRLLARSAIHAVP